MRTAGMKQITAEVTPEMKEQVQHAAAAQNVSEAEFLRQTLTFVFSISHYQMERKWSEDDAIEGGSE